MGILKSRFYLSAEVPLVEKIIGLFVVLLLLWAVIKIIKNHFASTLAGLVELHERAVGVVELALGGRVHYLPRRVPSRWREGLELDIAPLALRLLLC